MLMYLLIRWYIPFLKCCCWWILGVLNGARTNSKTLTKQMGSIRDTTRDDGGKEGNLKDVPMHLLFFWMNLSACVTGLLWHSHLFNEGVLLQYTLFNHFLFVQQEVLDPWRSLDPFEATQDKPFKKGTLFTLFSFCVLHCFRNSAWQVEHLANRNIYSILIIIDSFSII